MEKHVLLWKRPGSALSAAALISLAAVTVLPGCADSASEVYPVTIHVSYPDQRPVSGAQVVLRSQETGAVARGVTGDDGSCVVSTEKPGDGASLGLNSVIIAEPPLKGDPDVPSTGPQIADRYASFSTSGLEAIVTEDAAKNVFQFTVTPR